MSKDRDVPSWIREQPIYNTTWRNIYAKNKNALYAFVGQTGSAKSWSAMKFCWDMDRDYKHRPRFNIDKIVFTPEDFLNVVKSKMPAGSFIIWDEIGVGANARKWYSLRNQLISYVVQTFRFKNWGVLFTVPAMSFIDSQVRTLFHAQVEMAGADPTTQRAKGSWYWLDFNANSGKLYRKKPRYVNNENYYVCDHVTFAPPPKKLIEAYEEKKRNIADNWYKLFDKQIKAVKEEINKPRSNVVKEAYDKLIKDPELLKQVFDPKKRKASAPKLIVLLGVSRSNAYSLSRLLNDDLRSGKLDIDL